MSENNIYMSVFLKKQNILICSLLFLLIGVIAFYPSFSFPFFVFGDGEILQRFMQEKSLFSSFNFFESLSGPSPFSNFIWSLITRIVSEPTPLIYRTMNFGFHFFNSILLFFICRRLWKPHLLNEATLFISTFVSTLVFFLHPLNVQNVVWVSSLPAILTFTFVLMGTIFFIRSRDSHHKTPINKSLLIAYLLILLSFLCGRGGFLFPIIFLLLDLFYFKTEKKYALTLFSFFPLFGGLVFISWLNIFPDVEILTVNNFGNKLLLFLDNFKFSLFKIFVPYGLSLDYSRDLASISNSFLIGSFKLEFFGFYFCLLILMVSFSKKGEWKVLNWGILFIFITQLPFLNYLPISFSGPLPISNGQFYMGTIFCCFFFPLIIKRIEDKKNFNFNIKAVLILTVVFFIFFKYHRLVLMEWESNEKQLKQSLKYSPESFALNMGIGAYYKARGELTTALYYFKIAKELKGQSITAKNEIFDIYKAFDPEGGINMANIDFFFENVWKSLPRIEK